MGWVPVTVDYLEADSEVTTAFHALVVCGDYLVGIKMHNYYGGNKIRLDFALDDTPNEIAFSDK